MKPKILIVGDFSAGSGLTGVLFNVFPCITTECEVTAIGYGYEKSNYAKEKCQKLNWKFLRIPVVNQKPIRHWRFWHNFFKNHDYDLVYFNYSSSWNFLPVYFAKKYTHSKIVIHSHNSYFSHTFSNKLLMKLLIILNDIGRKKMTKYANVKIATSHEAAVWMFGKENIRDVLISVNGIKLSKFKYNSDYRNKIRRKYKIGKNEILFGVVGALVERKKPIFALKVFDLYHKINPNSKLIIVGKGPQEETIKKYIEKMSLTQCTCMVKYTNEIEKYYSAFDILLFPSKSEGLPLVLVEAQVSNLKILCTNNMPRIIFVSSNIKEINNYSVNEWIKDINVFLNERIDRNKSIPKELSKFSNQNQAKIIKEFVQKKAGIILK